MGKQKKQIYEYVQGIFTRGHRMALFPFIGTHIIEISLKTSPDPTIHSDHLVITTARTMDSSKTHYLPHQRIYAALIIYFQKPMFVLDTAAAQPQCKLAIEMPLGEYFQFKKASCIKGFETTQEANLSHLLNAKITEIRLTPQQEVLYLMLMDANQQQHSLTVSCLQDKQQLKLLSAHHPIGNDIFDSL